MPSTFTQRLDNGHTMHATRVGLEYDIDTRDAAGHSVASVRLSEARLVALLDSITEARH